MFLCDAKQNNKAIHKHFYLVLILKTVVLLKNFVETKLVFFFFQDSDEWKVNIPILIYIIIIIIIIFIYF